MEAKYDLFLRIQTFTFNLSRSKSPFQTCLSFWASSLKIVREAVLRHHLLSGGSTVLDEKILCFLLLESLSQLNHKMKVKLSWGKELFKPHILLLAEPFHLYILAAVISSEKPKETTKEKCISLFQELLKCWKVFLFKSSWQWLAGSEKTSQDEPHPLRIIIRRTVIGEHLIHSNHNWGIAI